ncbi:permease prefix domain 1-containing protein [Halalkalibacterium ligniniphilum]|uniref:permease prefix domain 1-containing protein n=1 Tax=Halalkalibacterium ligniniphilum TaxID=1134413 RepID=UPI00034551CE|nr:permease prefix domain 1-containing protein [Halalkalibacterium ligniniphilum]
MRVIDEYVDKLYKHANPKDPETMELKEETRIHLNESVQELIKEGYTESEAFKIAVERFGGFEQAEKLISLMEIRQKTFANWLLTVGISILVLVSFMFGFFLYLGNVHDAHFADIGYKIGENISLMDSELTDTLFVDEPLIFKASIYSKEARESNPQKADFTFEGNKRWVPDLFKRDLYYETNQFFVSLEVIDVRAIGFFLFAIGFTIYYVLFTVWGLIQLYHANRFKVVWILCLVMLNVVGYLLFLTKSKGEFRKKHLNIGRESL